MNKNIFVDTLLSDKCHREYQEKLRPYAPLIGNWDFEWVGHQEDGSTWSVPGEWLFSWVLEGRAIQDNWICPKRELRSLEKYPKGEYGTTIRIYDFKEEKINTFWFGTILSQFRIFEARWEDNKIIQEEIPFKNRDKICRWIFKDITEDNFKWEAHESMDNKESWKITQEVFATKKQIKKTTHKMV